MKKKELYKQLGIKYSFYTVFFKRFLDIFISLVALIILSPFMILFSLLTLIFNGWPIVYTQARPGKNHKVFNIYKFRSMNNKKDKDGNLLPDNQRITFWGKIIRKLSIDELPQLWNILKGDMSIIGHRPKLVKDVIFYAEDVFNQYVTRPGLTGYCQAFGRNKNTWEETFEKDKFYFANMSLWLDIKIFFMTFISVFKNKGESHSNAEEDKVQEKEQEYYYADYLLRIEKITKEQYDKGLELSKEIIKNKAVMTYQPELVEKQEEVVETKEEKPEETKTTKKKATTKKVTKTKKKKAE
ncbi:MAG: sugar transferase [Clostridiales bacterium]|nr:sugar transferase [Clostridiales bacterium]